MPRKNILLAMFDVKPTGRAASLVLGQIERELNLRIRVPLAEEEKKPRTIIERPAVPEKYWEELVAKLPQRPDFPLKYELNTFSKNEILQELEKTIQEPVDVAAELASVGGIIYKAVGAKSRSKVISYRRTVRGFSESMEPAAETVTAEPVKFAHSPASREIEVWLENLQKNRGLLSHASTPKKVKQPVFQESKDLARQFKRTRPHWLSWLRSNPKPMIWILAIVISGLLVGTIVRNQGIWARNNIIQNGSNAVANLEEAKKELENFDFNQAAVSFALAYDDLNKASGTLNHMGASFLSVFGPASWRVPGLNKIKAADNLVEAGQSLSKAGENLALAFGTLYKTNLLGFLDSNIANGRNQSISKLLQEFKDTLEFAESNINRAGSLLADIDASLIPPDKQEFFINFKEKIPEFQRYAGEAVDYSDFLLKLVGTNGPKTYLILFQNNSELRPTGGFPGSYALITFEGGAFKKVFVDDIYRADAGIKENIVPPIPLQHITPNWGMRDANWFADFPTSARKIIEFYRLGGGPRIDGVLTVTPDVISGIFEVIGPIEMPEYDLVLDADNFLATVQNEVEYVADRSAPKQILADLQPKFFKRLADQDKNNWLAIFNIISEAAKQKHILAFFNDPDLQEIAVKNGLGGEMKNTLSGLGQARDYLQVVFSNIKGSKTDFVTDNSMDLKTELGKGGDIKHTLTISRAHNGGSSKFGFYNRDNSAYIKVYVPRGTVLENIQGQSVTNFKPLVDYSDSEFKRDSVLGQVESSIKRPLAGVDIFEESGKTVFGFWLIIRPKETKSVTIKYSVPSGLNVNEYGLLWQKQSGTGSDQIDFSFKIPEGKKVVGRSEGIQTFGDSLVLSSDLTVDREINVELK